MTEEEFDIQDSLAPKSELFSQHCITELYKVMGMETVITSYGHVVGGGMWKMISTFMVREIGEEQKCSYPRASWAY